MTTITTGVAAATLDSTNSSWRRRIHTMPDGYRAVVSTDGTNISVKTAANGSSWGSATTIVAGTTLGPLIDTVVVGSKLYLFSGGATSVTCVALPYSGAGAWGAAVSSTPLSGLPYTPQSVRAVYDSTGATNDSQHTTGTGLIHLLVDTGPDWYVYALDPNTSATTKPKSVLSAHISTGITTPTYATNLILRSNGKLYALSSAGANGWRGFEIDYVTTSTTTPGGTPPPASHSFDSGGASTGPWFFNVFSSSGRVVALAAGATAAGVQSFTNPHTPPSSAVVGSYGATFAGYGGATIPAGTWGLNFTVNISGASGYGQIKASVYELLADGVTYRYIGALNTAATFFLSGTQSVTANTSAVFPQYVFATGSSLHIEWTYSTILGQQPLESDFGVVGKMWFGTGALTTPTPTSPPVVTTSYSFSIGSAESPGLPISSLGAAMSVAGANSVNNPVDIFVAQSGSIGYMQRNTDGSYAALQTLSAPGISTTDAPSAASDQNGSTSVFAQGTFGGNLHVGLIRKQGGLWGSYAQEDTSATALQPSSFAAIDVKSLGVAGNAIAYVNGSGTLNLIYEDAGFAAGAIAPTVNNLILIPSSSSSNDVFGVAAPYNITTLTPTFQSTYTEGLAGDNMSAFRAVVTRTDIGPSTVWDSGTVAPLSPVTPGSNWSVVYGSIGAAAIALVAGGSYTVTIYVTESVGGNTSVASTAVAFNVVTAPVITAVGPAQLTNPSQSFSFNYAQAQSIGAQSYQVQLLDTTGAVLFDSGNVVQSIAAGTTFTTPAFALQGIIKNNLNLTLKITAYTAPTSGASWSGSGSAAVVSNFPAPPVPSGLTVTPVPGANPISGGYDLVSWIQGTDNFIPNGDISTGGASATFYQDPFANTSGWDVATGISLASNVATLAASSGVLTSQSYFYNNNTLAVRFFNTATTKLDLRFMLPGSAVTGYSLRIDATANSIQFQKLTAGAAVAVGSNLTTAMTASAWYWAVLTFSVSGGVTTLSATIYNDSSGAQGTVFGTITSFTDSTYSALGGLSIANLGTGSQQIGGNADGSGFRLTGPSPLNWTAIQSLGVPVWGGWFFDPAAGLNVLAGRQVTADSTASFCWESASQAVPAGLSQITISADALGTTFANAQVLFYDSTNTLISTTSTVVTPGTSYGLVSALLSAPSNVAFVRVKLFMPNGSVGSFQGTQFQLEGGNTATPYHAQNTAVLASNNVYQRLSGTSAWSLVANVPALSGKNSLRSYSTPVNVAYDFTVTAVSVAGYESGGLVVSGVTLNNRVGLWLNDPVNPTNCVELGLQDMGDQFMQLEPVEDKDQAQLFGRQDIVPTVGTIYSPHIPEIVYQLEQGYEPQCLALLQMWDRLGTTLQFRSPWGDIFNVFVVAAKPGARHMALIRSVAIEFQGSAVSTVTLPYAQVSSDTSSAPISGANPIAGRSALPYALPIAQAGG